MSQLPTQLPMAATALAQTAPQLPAVPTPVDPGVAAGATAAGQSWGDILKGVVGNKMFMPMVLMAAMSAGKKKGRGGGMAAMLPMMMMMQQLQGAGAAPTAPAALPPTGTATA